MTDENNVVHLPVPPPAVVEPPPVVNTVSPVHPLRRVAQLAMVLAFVAPWWVGCYEIVRWVV